MRRCLLAPPDCGAHTAHCRLCGGSARCQSTRQAPPPGGGPGWGPPPPWVWRRWAGHGYCARSRPLLWSRVCHIHVASGVGCRGSCGCHDGRGPSRALAQRRLPGVTGPRGGGAGDDCPETTVPARARGRVSPPRAGLHHPPPWPRRVAAVQRVERFFVFCLFSWSTGTGPLAARRGVPPHLLRRCRTPHPPHRTAPGASFGKDCAEGCPPQAVRSVRPPPHELNRASDM